MSSIHHIISITDHDHLQDSHIFSEEYASREDVEDLLFAQDVAERQWNQTDVAVMAIRASAEIVGKSRLYEDVGLVEREDWGLIDESPIFLANESFFKISHEKEGNHMVVGVSTKAELEKLWETKTFVVVAVSGGSIEKR